MSDVTDLEALSKELQLIKRKTGVATEWRRRIIKRISEIVEILRQNPSNKEVRERLVKGLKRERQFLDMVRKGTKNGIKILNSTKKKLKRAKIDPREKVELFQLLQFLVDTMQFAKGKIKVIEKRIKKGERLEEKGHFDEFLQTMREEEEIDRELALILQGKSKKVRSKLNILKYMWKDKAIIAMGAGTAAIGAGVAYGGSMSYTSSGVPPSDAIPVIVATIIGIAAAIMLNFSASTFMAEERRRKGAKEIPFWRRF